MKKVFKIIYELRYYLLSIFILTLIVSILNAFLILRSIPWYFSFIMSFGSTILVIILDGFTASIIHHLPKDKVKPEKFKERKNEARFFNFIKIRKWKDKIPEIGELTCDFSKSSINDPNDPEYVYQFLVEMGYAEVIHVASCFVGILIAIPLLVFSILSILPWYSMLSISLVIIIINTIYNMLSALIQRYNRPKLYRVYLRQIQKKKEVRSKN